MQRQPRRDTKPELALRRELHRRGLRYRVARKPLSSLRRNIDIVFASIRVAVEVRGCFWHHCPKHGGVPKSNSAWWREKLARTRARDLDTEQRLRAAGWTLLLVWEHERAKDAADRIETEVARAKRRRGGGTVQRADDRRSARHPQ